MVNGERADNPTKNHIPSYIGLSCAVSGYRSINKYDAVIREGSSNHFIPARIAAVPSNENNQSLFMASNLNCNEYFLRQRPLIDHRMRSLSCDRARDLQNDSAMQKSIQQHNLNGHSPIHCSRYIKEYDSETNSKFSVLTESSDYNLNSNSKTCKSFIQQRIERLYGASLKHSIESQESDSNQTVKSSGEFPSVFKHLRPEFRHQLPYKPKTDGTSLYNNNVKERHRNDVTSDHKFNGQNGGKTCSSTSSEDTTDKSWKSLKKDIEAVHNPASPITSIDDNFKKLDLNKNHNLRSETLKPDEAIIKANGLKPVEAIIETKGQNEKDGHYFLDVVEEVVKNMEDKLAQIEKDLESDGKNMTEEVNGKIMAATGKAKLFINKKIKQFKGLCQNNISKEDIDGFPTTNEDLAGFWDMVMIQVDNIKELFNEIDSLRKNNWKEVTKAIEKESTVKKAPSTRKPLETKNCHPKSSERSKAAMERRKQMREAILAKKKEANKQKSSDNNDVIFM